MTAVYENHVARHVALGHPQIRDGPSEVAVSIGQDCMTIFNQVAGPMRCTGRETV